jgi:endoglucanase
VFSKTKSPVAVAILTVAAVLGLAIGANHKPCSASAQRVGTSVPTATGTPANAPVRGGTPGPVGCGTPTPPPSLHEEDVYSEGLASGWSNWSWNSTVNFDARSPVFSGVRSISWKPNSGFAGLYFHKNTPVDTTNYLYIRFSIRPGVSTQKFALQLYDENNQPFDRPISLRDLGGDPPVGTWTTFSVPLTRLKPAAAKVSGVALSDDTGAAQTTSAFVDAVKFSNVQFGKIPTPAPTPNPTATPNPAPQPTPPPGPSGSIKGLHRDGNQIKNENNEVIRIRGLNKSGTDYACYNVNNGGYGFADTTASLVQSTLTAMATWKSNAVRIPINPDCWLGTHASLKPEYSGTNYQNAINNWVNLIIANKMIPVFDVHVDRTTDGLPAHEIVQMPSMDVAVPFWTSAANYFKDRTEVIFELYNEPHPMNNAGTTAAWVCWRDGGAGCSGASGSQGMIYNDNAAGMQDLVDTVRATGATNLLLLGGIRYSNYLDQWLAHKPTDPLNNIAAVWHIYPDPNLIDTRAEYDSTVAPVAAQYPVVTTEFGDHNCTPSEIAEMLDFMEDNAIHMMAWTWNTWGTPCSGQLSLITNQFSDSPTQWGQYIRDHYHQFVGTTPPPPPPPSNTVLSIYTDALASGWADWSFSATRDFQNTSPAAAVGQFNVELATTADFGALNLRFSAGFDTSPYTHLKFRARRASGNTVNYTAFFKDANDADLTKVSLTGQGGQPSTTEWTSYSIPLTTLGASNTTVKAVLLQAGSGATGQTAYFDEIVLENTGGGSGGGQTYFSEVPPGSAIPVAKETCLANIKQRTENRNGTRPGVAYEEIYDNRTENQYVAVRGVDYNHDGENQWTTAKGWNTNQANTYLQAVDGNPGDSTLTTDELIQFYACRWGFDEDLVRAQSAKESWWRQKTHGDVGNGESYGILQIKQSVHRVTYPASSKSTAYNLDWVLAWHRTCFEGWMGSWVVTTESSKPYVSGDHRGCMTIWFSGRWYIPSGVNYLNGVNQNLADRVWEGASFPPPQTVP